VRMAHWHFSQSDPAASGTALRGRPCTIVIERPDVAYGESTVRANLGEPLP
jgi:hypothetical protein